MFRYLIRQLIVYAFVSMTLTQSVLANSQDDINKLLSLSLRELLDISVVTATKREQTIEDVAASVTVLSQADLSLLGFNTLQDAMEYVVGFSAVSGESNIWNGYSIRGDTVVNFNTNTLLLLDGFRLQNPLFGSFDLTSFPLTAIERIEVIKGAQSVTYGSNAVNAVINIITRKRNREGGEVEARAGEFGTRYAAANWTTVINDWALSGFVEKHSSDNQTLPLTSERDETVQYNKWLDNHNATFSAVSEKWQILGMHHRRAQPNFLTRSFTFVRETDVRANLLGIKYSTPINSEWEIDAQLSRYSWQADRDFFRQRQGGESSALLTLASFSDQVDRQIFYDGALVEGITELRWKPSNTVLWKLGGQYAESYGRRFQTNLNDYDIGRFKDTTYQSGIFLNLEWQASENLHVNAGLRHEDYDYRFSGTGDTANFDDLMKEASVIWSPNNQYTFKLIYGESFRVPTYFEKEANTASTAGNPNLSPEYSESFDLVFVKTSLNYTLDINVFQSNFESDIGRGVAPDGRRQNQNLGESDIRGVESNLRWTSSNSDIYGFAGLGIYRGEREDAEGTTIRLPFTYDYMLTAGGRYQLTPGLAVTASLKHLSDWGDAPSYTLVNVGLRVVFSRLPNVAFSMDIRNVMEEDVLMPEVSRQAPQVASFPVMTERMAQIGVKLTF